MGWGFLKKILDPRKALQSLTPHVDMYSSYNRDRNKWVAEETKKIRKSGKYSPEYWEYVDSYSKPRGFEEDYSGPNFSKKQWAQVQKEKDRYAAEVGNLNDKWLETFSPEDAEKRAKVFQKRSGKMDRINKIGKTATLSGIAAVAGGALAPAIAGAVGAVGGGAAGTAGGMTAAQMATQAALKGVSQSVISAALQKAAGGDPSWKSMLTQAMAGAGGSLASSGISALAGQAGDLAGEYPGVTKAIAGLGSNLASSAIGKGVGSLLKPDAPDAPDAPTPPPSGIVSPTPAPAGPAPVPATPLPAAPAPTPATPPPAAPTPEPAAPAGPTPAEQAVAKMQAEIEAEQAAQQAAGLGGKDVVYNLPFSSRKTVEGEYGDLVKYAAKGGPVTLEDGGFVMTKKAVDGAGGFHGLRSILPHAKPIIGPGTGTSDHIPAKIVGPRGQQPARVSNGEAVLPRHQVLKAGGAARLKSLMKQLERRS